ncbi:hypothetical protein C8F01DRAFT_939150, partial [Mycena amicta]
TADRVLLNVVRKMWMNIQLETCGTCKEKWFDLKVKEGKCKKCTNSTKFSAANQMDPGPAPDLPVLTQMEEILISPVHALTQVWQIHG